MGWYKEVFDQLQTQEAAYPYYGTLVYTVRKGFNVDADENWNVSYNRWKTYELAESQFHANMVGIKDAKHKYECATAIMVNPQGQVLGRYTYKFEQSKDLRMLNNPPASTNDTEDHESD